MITLLSRYMDDKTASWHLNSDGDWIRHYQDEDGNPLTDVQFWLVEEHARRRNSGRNS